MDITKVDYLILGAGPAGLTFSALLKKAGINSFLVLDKLNEVGGLCRSKIVDDSYMDIGGGHFLDTTRTDVLEFLFDFMPEKEWNHYERISKIFIHNSFIDHPIESNLWQLDFDNQFKYIMSIINSQKTIDPPTKFTDWIYWKLGNEIANNYMLPYNRKLFSSELDELGTYWLNKLPNVDLNQTIMSIIQKKTLGDLPAHKNFLYPKKYGYGEVWSRIGRYINSNLSLNSQIKELDFTNKTVLTNKGSYQAEIIINTIPWGSFEKIINLPIKINNSISLLKHNSITTRYYSNNYPSNAHWIYFPNEKIYYHRILLRSNFLPNSKGFWTESRSDREIFVPVVEKNNPYFINDYAYPLNTINKPLAIKNILDFFSNFQIYGLGRWGEHEHYNSDVTVQKAMNLFKKIVIKQ